MPVYFLKRLKCFLKMPFYLLIWVFSASKMTFNFLKPQFTYSFGCFPQAKWHLTFSKCLNAFSVNKSARINQTTRFKLNLIYLENRSFCPHPKSLSLLGRGTSFRLRFWQIWEKGLGDEGFSFHTERTTVFKVDAV